MLCPVVAAAQTAPAASQLTRFGVCSWATKWRPPTFSPGVCTFGLYTDGLARTVAMGLGLRLSKIETRRSFAWRALRMATSGRWRVAGGLTPGRPLVHYQ
jgi:hypothetical protein